VTETIQNDALLSFRNGAESWLVTPAFAPFYQKYFQNGLSELLSKHSTCLKQGSKKAVFLLTLTNEQTGKDFFLKIYKHNGLFRRMTFLFRKPRGLQEFYTGIKIRQRGIATMVPSAAGSRRKKGFIQESYVINEKIEHTENLNILLRKDHEQYKAIPSLPACMRTFGSLVRTMHERGVFQEDLAVSNFLLGIGEENAQKIYLIDYERIRITRSISEAEQQWVLSKLNRVGSEISVADRLRFLQGYYAKLTKEEVKAKAREIDKQTTQRLKKDVLHRISNVHTTANYRFFQDEQYSGYHHRKVSCSQIIDAVEAMYTDIGASVYQETGTIGEQKAVIFFHPADSLFTERLWKLLWGLTMARVPVVEPLAMVKRKKGTASAFVMPIEEKSRSLQEYLQTTQGAAQHTVLRRSLERIFSRLHQLNVYGNDLSGDEIVAVEDSRGGVLLRLADITKLTALKKPDAKRAALDSTFIEQMFSQGSYSP